MSDTLVIAGSRTITRNRPVREALNESPFGYPWGGEVLTGGARGVYQCTREIIEGLNDIEYREIRPDYAEGHTKSAPLARNEIMAQQGDKLLAVWDGTSAGTRHMIGQALDHSLDIYVKVHQPMGLF